MKTKSPPAESPYTRLLASAFTADEITRLCTQRRFRFALAATTCYSDFERLCFIGRRLLLRGFWHY